MEFPEHPSVAEITSHYLTNDDESVKVLAMCINGEEAYKEVYSALSSYKWRKEDILLATYQKNGK